MVAAAIKKSWQDLDAVDTFIRNKQNNKHAKTQRTVNKTEQPT